MKRKAAPRNERGTRRCLSAMDAERPFEIVNRPAVGAPSQSDESMFGTPSPYTLVANRPGDQSIVDDFLNSHPIWDQPVFNEIIRYATPTIHEIVSLIPSQQGRPHTTLCTMLHPNGSLIRNINVASAYVCAEHVHLRHLYAESMRAADRGTF